MIVFGQLNYTKIRRFHAIFMTVIIEFLRCISTYSSAKFEAFIFQLHFAETQGECILQMKNGERK